MNDCELDLRLAEINAREPEEPTEEDLMAIRAAEAEPDGFVTFDEFKREMEASVHPYADMTEDEILRKLERSREQAKQGMYRDADEVLTDMREKYHLRGLRQDDDQTLRNGR